MVKRTKAALLCHVQSECEELQTQAGLPFQKLLSGERITEALERNAVEFRDRIYNPMVTIWTFLSQVIAGKEQSSCQNAVSRVLAERIARGEKPCSTDTTSYCGARRRLPEPIIPELTRGVGQELHRQAKPPWLYKGRPVVIVDGSTVTMPDTKANQAAFPQSRNQKAGLGFPILRFVVLLSLAAGTALECAISPCRGKKTGEETLFRQIWGALQAGDILLGDSLYDAYRDIALLRARGVDVVFGKKQSRKCDFRRGRKLAGNDHVVVWKKPKYDASRFASKEEWEALPAEMEMREVRVRVRRKGYRTRTIIIVTTLLDGEQHSAAELANLFAERWHCELDLRSIKQALGMHKLRCKDPDMVVKELWTYLLAYNLIRVRMAQAAVVHGVMPRKISFTAAKNHIVNFAPYLCSASSAQRDRIERELINAIAQHQVGHRPGRKEPRAVKERKQKYPYLTKPRHQARKQLAA